MDGNPDEPPDMTEPRLSVAFQRQTVAGFGRPLTLCAPSFGSAAPSIAGLSQPDPRLHQTPVGQAAQGDLGLY